MAEPPAVANAVASQYLSIPPSLDPTPGRRAAVAALRLKAAEDCFRRNLITEEELGEQQIFAHQLTADAANEQAGNPPAPPAWFGPALQQALQQALQPALQPVIGRLDNIEARFEARFDNLEARQTNAAASTADDPISPLRNATGVFPPNFPTTVRAFTNLDSEQCGDLLQFYQLNRDPEEMRRTRLQKFLGLTW